MNKFAYKIAQFMAGRHGMDQFSRDLIAYGLIITILDIFIPTSIATYLGYTLVIFAFYRIFSRNHSKMNAQLAWYRTYFDGPLRSYLNRDRKNYTYFKCPTCKQVQKAPKGRGRIRVTCHKCGNVFEKKV
ncbi:MAG: hypothetical protein IJN72_04855 [Firmicutes bacterium]|nr:hypothetical protein [Bacillota bacterium]